MISNTTTKSIANTFIQDLIDDIKNRFSDEIETHCKEYAEKISDKMYREAMKQLNGLRIDINEAMKGSGLEIKIVVMMEAK